MDKRLYFAAGDFFTNLSVGALVGWLCWCLVGPQWNMYIAMFSMMLLGMAVAVLVFIPASMLFGAMEVMLPTMFSGMLSGMVVGMWIPMSPLSAVNALAIGAVSGAIGILVIWFLNTRWRGVQALDQ